MLYPDVGCTNPTMNPLHAEPRAVASGRDGRRRKKAFGRTEHWMLASARYARGSAPVAPSWIHQSADPRPRGGINVITRGRAIV